ncbi:MAG: hypothetical protein KDN22_25280 [Verrucomicrobiae bacterium]|nr:hypothetical protein [Verrucomicrobiae bacterium]
MNPDHIGRAEFSKHYGIAALPHYSDFCGYVAEKLVEATDPETIVTNLRIESSWKDAGSNRHAAVRADGSGRDEAGLLGADIVLLIRSKRFRGGFWSHIPKHTDSDYFADARSAFYRRDYPEFLRLAAFIEDAYKNSRAFRKMIQIAERQTNNAANKARLDNPLPRRELT